MKIVLLITVFSCCLAVGIHISRYYKRRKVFYTDLCDFIDSTKLSISYSQSKLGEIVGKVKNSYNLDFKLFLSSFQKYLSGKITLDEFKMSEELNFLSVSERFEVIDLFSVLGNMAKEEEMERLEKSSKKYEQIKEKVILDNKKFSGLYLKLFIVLGIAFVIIFI